MVTKIKEYGVLRLIAIICIFQLPLLLFSQQSGTGVRFALVVGNSEYIGISSLRNPVNDASDMAAALSRLGFTVDLLTNADQGQMEAAIVRFGQRLSSSSETTGLFFFAGHGVQTGGENYLIPSRTSIASEAFLRSRAVSMQAVMETLNSAGNSLNIVLLDACRDNPFGWARSGSRGLSVVGQQPAGSIIVYATSAGSTASDGNGRNGVFTGELLKHLETPGLDVSEIFRRTGAAVSQVSAGRQIPAVYNQFFGSAIFKSGPSALSFGAVTVATGSLTITVTSAATVSLLGQSVYLPAGGSLPVNNLGVGDVSVMVLYSDGKTESLNARIEANKNVNLNLSYQVDFALAASTPVPTAAAGRIPPTATTVGQSWTSPGGIKFMAVPGGSFQMGSPSGGENDERPVHQVSISGFWMSATEVTQAQWQSVMDNNPSNFKTGSEAPNRPVEMVSWYDVLVFCNKLSLNEGLTPVYSIGGHTNPSRWGAVPTSSDNNWNAVILNRQANGYRLPTEAEWEYSAKGGPRQQATSILYAGSSDLNAVAWCEPNSGGSTNPVATKVMNPLGLYDLSGNVDEWCWDSYGRYDSNSQTDPMGVTSGTYRVVRGGSWSSFFQTLRTAFRYYSSPSYRSNNYGFRLVRTTP